MKMVIDIPDGYMSDGYNFSDIQNGSIACGRILNAVKNGKPYEERPIWHNIKDNPADTPKQVGWYACKIKSSDDLCMVFGASEITSGKYDYWSRIECPL